jgi:hypothetical protein
METQDKTEADKTTPSVIKPSADDATDVGIPPKVNDQPIKKS